MAISRRTTLGVLGGTTASFCANLANLAQAADGKAKKARSVILIFNSGAPSHLDLWDPKPDANESTRGPFATIDTNVAGSYVTELLPRMAQRMDKLAVVRTVQHKHTSHNAGMYWSIVRHSETCSRETVTTKDTKSTKMEFDDLSNRVIECAIEVHRQLGPGLLINFNVTRLIKGIKRFVL